MAFWVNQELLDQAGLDRLSCLSDLEILQKKLQNTGKYAYGDAWEISYIYNSISEYVDFFRRRLYRLDGSENKRSGRIYEANAGYRDDIRGESDRPA